VLEKIRLQQVTMRPRIYFTLKSIALGVVAVFTLLLSVSIGSFILFTIRTSYTTALLGFGPSGLVIFLQLFPWPLLILDIASIVLLEWMLRKFRLVYRSPLLYLLFGILVLILSASAILDTDHISDLVLRGAHDQHIPFMGDFYDRGRRPPPPGSGACPCTVLSVSTSTIVAQENVPNETAKQVVVMLPADIATSTIHVGDRIFFFGRYDNGVLDAVGLHLMDGDTDRDDGFGPPAPIAPNPTPANQ
jgi:hypothetical protein